MEVGAPCHLWEATRKFRDPAPNKPWLSQPGRVTEIDEGRPVVDEESHPFGDLIGANVADERTSECSTDCPPDLQARSKGDSGHCAVFLVHLRMGAPSVS